MTRYIKKPIPVEARQYIDDTILEWINKDGDNAFIDYVNRLCVHTPMGLVHCDEGCYIIKGIEGEFYPMREDIFNKTYEVYKEE